MNNQSPASVEFNKATSLCRKWIQTWVSKRKSINRKFGSSRLKHVVEATVKPEYITCEAFIAAATSLGYKAQYYNDVHAYFDMSFRKMLADPENSGFLHSY